MPVKLTQQQVIDRMVQAHGNKYDYSQVEYVNSKLNVIIKCPIHGTFKQTPESHMKGQGCPQCRTEKTSQTIQRKYGVQFASQIPTKKEKTKATLISRYGHENAAHGEVAKEKIKHTNIERYGTEKSLQSPIVRQKIKDTCINRYGVDCATKDPTVQQKARQGSLKKYGFHCPLSDPEIYEKSRQTCLTKYGYLYPSQVPEIREIIKQTNTERYGASNHSQQHMIPILNKLEDADWLFDQYITQQKTAEHIAAELGISDNTVGKYLRQSEIAIKSINQYSYKCIRWLTNIMQTENVHIQHALNGGEYVIPGTRLKADGYCKETNTIYEFHGDLFHGNPKLYSPDQICHPYSKATAGELYATTIKKETKIRSMGYDLVVMWESDFVND